MIEPLLIVINLLLILAIALLIVLLRRKPESQLLHLENQIAQIEKGQERTERSVKDEIAKNRDEATLNAKQGREEMANTLNAFRDSLLSRMTEIATLQKNQLDTFSTQLSKLTESNEGRMDEMRRTIEEKIKSLQEDNSKKLEQMRVTVDEKLQSTLEKRLGESFKRVSERLEMVQRGLGEMQTLASSVGDLKKVLTNVKTRGTWGEVQLGNLLEQILTSEQYASNVATKKGSADRVEYAIRLPGRSEIEGVVWLPIDAKFPQEDYQRLLEAQDNADQALAESTGKQLEARIKKEAKEIREKYIDPPGTTDFAVMFLPVEGLYAEVLRRPGLCDNLQRDFRVIVTGPTTLAALLNSLQMGFRTLAIEKRSSEVWILLGAVKTEFGKFGDILEKTQKKLHEASNTIEAATKKSRTIERKLRDVQELPSSENPSITDELD
ncbi:MAG: DNA recombination protein RmuC [Proteobacteria bacterium]|nr:DNA recombination protein RmuC [Pseudomonadota bacterium]